MRNKVVIGIAGLALAGAVTGAVAAHANGHDSDANVHGHGAQQATRAALQYTHGGTANSVERDTEDGATWEVEVTRTDGSTVDVRLDQNYGLVVIDGDRDSANGQGDSNGSDNGRDNGGQG